MADEIQIQSCLIIKKGSVYVTSFPGVTSFRDDMTGTNAGSFTQAIETTVEALEFGEVISGGNQLGWFEVRNNDPLLYVDISYGDSVGRNFDTEVITRIKPGMAHCQFCHPSHNAIYAMAESPGPVQVSVVCGQV